MLDTPCSEVVWRVLATHSIRMFPLQFPSRASPYVITFQLDSTWWRSLVSFTLLSLYPLWNSHRYTLNRSLVGPQSRSWRFREEQIFCPLPAVEPRFLSCSASAITFVCLDAFVELRRATIGFVMSVRPSLFLFIRMEQLGSHWTDFHEIWCLRIFRKCAEKIQVD